MTRKLFLISAAAAVISLILIFIIMGMRISNLSKELSENNLLYNSELENSKMLIDELSQNIQILASG
ncbi:MAG: hypothetical protein JEY91_15170, partial [Spirochaetaceae bacterium]|nr:hypothetical protein [Spirochaetaceae bacterium]